MANIKPPTLGEMRYKCSIQAQADSTDQFGYNNGAWSDVIPEIWAAISSLNMPVIFVANQEVIPAQKFLIRLRNRPAIAKAMRVHVLSTGRNFQIDDIDNIEGRDEWLALKCLELK